MNNYYSIYIHKTYFFIKYFFGQLMNSDRSTIVCKNTNPSDYDEYIFKTTKEFLFSSKK